MNESPPLFDNGGEKSSEETEGVCGMTKTYAHTMCSNLADLLHPIISINSAAMSFFPWLCVFWAAN